MSGCVYTCNVIVTSLSLLLAQTEGAPWPDEVFQPAPSRLSQGTAPGRAQLEPSALTPAAVGTYTLRFTAGDGGIAVGGGIMVNFPKAWFTNPTPLVKPMQQDAPDGFHYIGVTSDSPEPTFGVKVDRLDFTGKTERFRHMITVTVEGAALDAGDRIDVTLANTTSPYLAGPDTIAVAVDADASGDFRLIAQPAKYLVARGPAASLLFIAPSQAVVGEAAELQLTFLDRFDNVAAEFSGAVQITGLGANPVWLEIDTANQGIQRFRWTPRASGVVFPKAEAATAKLEAAAGPIRVFDSAPQVNVYWGDLHSHSRISKDGIGAGDFAYARDAAGLDFFASTEHDISDNGQDSITPAEWKFIREQVRSFNDPGRFVTLLAYECSLGGGHHNVFYRELEGWPWPTHRLKTIDTIWAQLQAGRALTIPHHLGIRWGNPPVPLTGAELQAIHTGPGGRSGPTVDWTQRHNEVLRPALEMYSKHGTSEFYDASDPLAYEQVRYTGATSADGPHYAQDAWAAGHLIGTVAASDNHMAHPGLAHTGLTAVIAPELTRDAVFDAILQRRTYATTGARILLDFTIAGARMGSIARARDEVEATVTVVAPGRIKYAEVLAHLSGESGWTAVKRWDNPGNVIDDRFTFDAQRAGAVCYLRVELEDKIGGRAARAWSSPVWLKPED